MEEKDIKNRHAHIYWLKDLYELEEIDRITLHPQPFVPGNALTPEATVVISNTADLYIGIHLAMGPDGKVYCGLTISEDESGGGYWPSLIHSPMAEYTVRKALRNFLKEHLGKCLRNGKPHRKVREAATGALRQINESGVRQMTIFDML